MYNQSIVIVVSPVVALYERRRRKCGIAPYGRPSATMTQRNVRAVYVGDADIDTEFEVCTAPFQLAYLRFRTELF